MKHTIIFLLLCYFYQPLWGQPTTVEQLIADGFLELEGYRYEAAIEKGKVALDLLLKEKQTQYIKTDAYTLLSRSYERLGLADTATQIAKTGIALIEDITPLDIKARAYAALSAAYFSTFNRGEAVKQVNKAFEQIDALSPKVQIALYAQKATLMIDAQQLNVSLVLWGKAAQKAKQVFDAKHPLIPYYIAMQQCCLALGIGKINTGIFDACLDVFAATPDKYLAEQLLVYNLLTMMCSNTGQFSRGITCSEKAQSLAARVMGERHPRAAMLTLNAGNLALQMGDPLKALHLYKSCSAHFPDESEGMAKALDNLGLCYLYAGMLDSAYHYNRKGLPIRRRSPDAIMDLITSVINQATIALKRQDFTTAKVAADEGLRLVHDVKNSIVFSTDTLDLRTIQAFCAVADKRYVEAIAILKDVLNVRKRYAVDYFNLAMAHQNLGDAYWEQGHITEALAQYDTTLLTSGFKNAGFVGLEPQKNLLWGSGFQAHLADKERQLGAKNKDIGLLTRAFERSVAMLALYSEFRRYHLPIEGVFQIEKGFSNAIFEVLLATALDLYALNNQSDCLKRAFSLIDASKGYRITDHLRRQEAMGIAGFSALVKSRARSLEDGILGVSIEIGQAQQPGSGYTPGNLGQLLQQQSQLVAAYQQFRDSLLQNEAFSRLSGIQKGVSIEEVREILLKTDEIALEYVDTGINTYVFVVTKEAISLKKLDINNNRLYALIQQCRHTIEQLGDPEKYPKALKQYADSANYLYNVLFRDLGITLPLNVTIVPDGALATLPFDALLCTPAAPEQVRGAVPVGELDYFTQHHAVRMGFSLTQLVEDLERPVRANWDRPAIALAPFSRRGLVISSNNPNMPRSKERNGFGPLEYSGTEAGKVHEMYKGSTLLLDSAATKSALLKLAVGSKILHIATHGLSDPLLGYRSFLLFAEVFAGSEQGILPGSEIYGLNLSADLTVLSACQTGTGFIEGGEGALGLCRAFMYAGSRSVVATNWSVNDGATATIMEAFYRNLQTMPKHQALQEAKRQYLRETTPAFTTPYFWAAPVFYGNMQKM